MKPKVIKLFKTVMVLSFLAMLTTIYLTYMHFKPSAADVCTFGDQWNCDIVNQSQWSYINLGFVKVPVAILGFLTYAFFFVVSWLIVKGFDFRKIFKMFTDGFVLNFLTIFAVFGVAFSLYLSWIEAFVLYTFCLFCVTQQVLIIFIMVLFFMIRGASRVSGDKGACACTDCDCGKK